MGILTRLLDYALVGLLCGLLSCQSSVAAEAEDTEARNINLSMAGALINDWCEKHWQDSAYITTFACNYELAQQYNLALSSADFLACAELTGGDVIKIADCMVARFNGWLASSQKEGAQ